jgi:hypothetical protein
VWLSPVRLVMCVRRDSCMLLQCVLDSGWCVHDWESLFGWLRPASCAALNPRAAWSASGMHLWHAWWLCVGCALSVSLGQVCRPLLATCHPSC